MPGRIHGGAMTAHQSRPIPREHAEQSALFKWAWANRSKNRSLELMFAIPNGGHRHIGVARKLKAEGVKPGVPDIFLPWPVTGSQWPNKTGYSGLFLEMKSSTGRVSPEQADYLSALRDAGYMAMVCYDWKTAAQVICDYLGLNERSCGL
jgi:hypothetical protein